MKANLRRIKKTRRYSETFKKELVGDFESGKFSVLELSKLHGVPYQSIYTWIYRYSSYNTKGYRIVEKNQSSSKKVKDLEKKVKELEQIVGKKQIMIDYLEKMMEIAKDELDIDIKKNYNTSQSAGSGKTKKK